MNLINKEYLIDVPELNCLKSMNGVSIKKRKYRPHRGVVANDSWIVKINYMGSLQEKLEAISIIKKMELGDF